MALSESGVSWVWSGLSWVQIDSSAHVVVTLDANADTLLSLSTQEIGLDTQSANLIFAGPAAGGAVVPTFRSLVDADIPAAIARDSELHTEAHAAAEHNAAVLPASANENLGAFYLDIDDIAVPANPGAGIRRLFVDDATGELSVRTSAGVTVTLESQGITDHGGLTGLGDDDHSIYALLAGRAGGQTLQGGTASGDDLILESTAHATKGQVQVEGHIYLESGTEKILRWDTGDEQTFDTSTNTYTVRIATVDAIVGTPTVLEINAVPVELQRQITLIADDVTFTSALNVIETASTITLDFVNTQMQAYRFAPTVELLQTANPFGLAALFNNQGTFKNNPALAVDLGPVFTFVDQPTLQADAQSINMGAGAGIKWDFLSQPAFEGINGGDLTCGQWGQFVARGEVRAGATVTIRRGVDIQDVAVAGTLTTQVGVDIAALSAAGTNIGSRNASTTVYTPRNQLVTAGATILSDATVVEIRSTGAVTMTSTPTIADGQDGQYLIIINIDAVDTITLQDEGTLAGSNLRLAGAANLALGPRDSVTLVFSSSLGDWIRVGGSNN